MPDVIDIRQLDEVRSKFTDLGEAIHGLSADNTSFLESLSSNLEGGFKSVIDSVASDPRLMENARTAGVSEQYVSSVAGKFSGISRDLMHSFSSLEKTLTGAERSFGTLIDDIHSKTDKGESTDVPDGEGADSDAHGGKKEGGRKKKKSIGGRIARNEVKALTGRVSSLLGKLKLPRKIGEVGAGVMGIITYGVMDAARVKAEAGEIKNILIAAYDDGVKNSVAKGTASLSKMQEAFQKYKGINREEIQNTAQAFVDGGFSVDQMLRRTKGDLKDVQASALTMTLALDKMFELPGGTSARKMVNMMASYGKTADEARESLLRLYMVGRDSGIGAEQFIKNVETASESLEGMGFNIDNVVDLYSAVSKEFEKMNVPKQFAGKQAALGMQQIAGGLAKMSDDWMMVLGTRMGKGTGLEARQNMVDAIARVTRDHNVNELQQIISNVWDMAMGAAGGNEDSARYFVEKTLGWGFEGARAVATIGKMAKDGRMVESVKATEDNFGILKNSFETEKQKANSFELLLNGWLKGLAKLGQGILGYIIQFIAYLIAYFNSLPTFFNNMIHGKFEDNVRLSGELHKLFGDFSGPQKDVEAGGAQMWDYTKQGALSFVGKATQLLSDSSNYDPTGIRPPAETPPATGGAASAAVTPGPNAVGGGGGVGMPVGGSTAPRIFTIPIDVSGHKPVSQILHVTAPQPAGSGDVFDDLWFGGSVNIDVEGPSPLGDLTLIVSGNCPKCGFDFSENKTAKGQEAQGEQLGAYNSAQGEPASPESSTAAPGASASSPYARKSSVDPLLDSVGKYGVKGKDVPNEMADYKGLPGDFTEGLESGVQGTASGYTGEDVYAMARMIESESGGSRGSQQAVIDEMWSVLNKGKGVSHAKGNIKQRLTGGAGYGRFDQDKKRGLYGKRYASTRRAPTKATLELARKFLSGGFGTEDPTHGGTGWADVPAGSKPYSRGWWTRPEYAGKYEEVADIPSSHGNVTRFIRPIKGKR